MTLAFGRIHDQEISARRVAGTGARHDDERTRIDARVVRCGDRAFLDIDARVARECTLEPRRAWLGTRQEKNRKLVSGWDASVCHVVDGHGVVWRDVEDEAFSVVTWRGKERKHDG